VRVPFGYGGLRLTSVARGRQPFLIRARRKVIVQAEVRGRRQRLSLGRLPHRSGRATRYHRARHGTQKVLSALSMARYLLSSARSGPQARTRLAQVLSRLAHGRGVALLPAFSP